MLAKLTELLLKRQDLSEDAIESAVTELANGSVSAEAKAEFLSALSSKGETTSEIAGFARSLRELSIRPSLDAEVRSQVILDVCGTGGDRLNTFNISTTVAIIAASAGVTVAKHGNRAITSQAGSADVLEALGIRIDLSPEEAARSLQEHQFAFFFAPRYHPAFQHIGPARKLCAERGQRTIFNFLGPLLNPARPDAQLIGVPRPELCESIGRVLQLIGIRRGMVVSGQVKTGLDDQSIAHLDELSTLGPNTVAEFFQDRGFATSTLLPENFPIKAAALADLTGGDRQANATIVKGILLGQDQGPRRDAVLLNAAAALFVADKVRSLTDGWDLALRLLENGDAARKLKALSGT